MRAHARGDLQHQRGDRLLLRRGEQAAVREQVLTRLKASGAPERGVVRVGLEELALTVGVGPVRVAVRAHAVGVGERDLEVRRARCAGRATAPHAAASPATAASRAASMTARTVVVMVEYMILPGLPSGPAPRQR